MQLINENLNFLLNLFQLLFLKSLRTMSCWSFNHLTIHRHANLSYSTFLLYSSDKINVLGLNAPDICLDSYLQLLLTDFYGTSSGKALVCWAEGSGELSVQHRGPVYLTWRSQCKSESCYALASRASMFQI